MHTPRKVTFNPDSSRISKGCLRDSLTCKKAFGIQCTFNKCCGRTTSPAQEPRVTDFISPCSGFSAAWLQKRPPRLPQTPLAWLCSLLTCPVHPRRLQHHLFTPHLCLKGCLVRPLSTSPTGRWPSPPETPASSRIWDGHSRATGQGGPCKSLRSKAGPDAQQGLGVSVRRVSG